MTSLPPLVEPVDALQGDGPERFSRTIALPGIGEDGQRRLAGARVLVLGAGGLGAPLLQYLAAAGVGTIGIVDFDTVDLSNLQRQVIHQTSSIGERKTTSAARAIGALNPAVSVVEHPVQLSRDNALSLFSGYDLIADGTDNFATRYLANDAAALLNKPYVWGSVLRFDGQVTVFWEGAPDGRSLDYRDLHPVPPAPEQVLSCAEAGVLGSVCATIGAMMATEVLKLVTGIGEPLLGRVQNLDALTGEWREFRLRRSADRIPVRELIDYELFCGIRPPDAATEITVDELAALRGAAGDPADGAPVPGARRLIDVREPYEHERDHLAGDMLVPLARVLDDPSAVGPGPVIVYCATGARSGRAAAALRSAGVDAVSLRGGITAWRAAHPRG